jgi:hypothetical protein
LRRLERNVVGAFRASRTTTGHRIGTFALLRGYFGNDTPPCYVGVMTPPVQTVRMTPEMRRRVEVAGRGRSFSAVVREALDAWLAANEQKEATT